MKGQKHLKTSIKKEIRKKLTRTHAYSQRAKSKRDGTLELRKKNNVIQLPSRSHFHYFLFAVVYPSLHIGNLVFQLEFECRIAQTVFICCLCPIRIRNSDFVNIVSISTACLNWVLLLSFSLSLSIRYDWCAILQRMHPIHSVLHSLSLCFVFVCCSLFTKNPRVLFFYFSFLHISLDSFISPVVARARALVCQTDWQIKLLDCCLPSNIPYTIFRHGAQRTICVRVCLLACALCICLKYDLQCRIAISIRSSNFDPTENIYVYMYTFGSRLATEQKRMNTQDRQSE